MLPLSPFFCFGDGEVVMEQAARKKEKKGENSWDLLVFWTVEVGKNLFGRCWWANVAMF